MSHLSGYRSSLIQVVELSERPCIVPPEVIRMPLRPCTGSLAETVRHLMGDDVIRIKALLFFHQCPGNDQKFGRQLNAHLGANAFFPLTPIKQSMIVVRKVCGQTGGDQCCLVDSIAQVRLALFGDDRHRRCTFLTTSDSA